jgi:hypothetical protein
MYRLLLGSMNFHRIFEHLQKHDVRTQIHGKFHNQDPQNTGTAWSTWSLGFVNPCTTTDTLPTSVYYLRLCNF